MDNPPPDTPVNESPNAFRALFNPVRPLAGAHWSLLALLMLAGVVSVFSVSCARAPHYFAAVVLAVAVCLVLWCNHLAKAPLRSGKAIAMFAARSTYDILALLVLFVVVCVPLAAMLPAGGCYTDRARAAEILLAASSLRAEIAAKAMEAGSVRGAGRGLVLAPPGRVRVGVVTDDGVIVLAAEDPAVVFMLSPALADGKVSWVCKGFPERLVPLTCRSS